MSGLKKVLDKKSFTPKIQYLTPDNKSIKHTNNFKIKPTIFKTYDHANSYPFVNRKEKQYKISSKKPPPYVRTTTYPFQIFHEIAPAGALFDSLGVNASLYGLFSLPHNS